MDVTQTLCVNSGLRPTVTTHGDHDPKSYLVPTFEGPYIFCSKCMENQDTNDPHYCDDVISKVSNTLQVKFPTNLKFIVESKVTPISFSYLYKFKASGRTITAYSDNPSFLNYSHDIFSQFENKGIPVCNIFFSRIDNFHYITIIGSRPTTYRLRPSLINSSSIIIEQDLVYYEQINSSESPSSENNSIAPKDHLKKSANKLNVKNLIDNIVTGNSLNALDRPDKNIAVRNKRKTVTVNSPSGPVDAIILSDNWTDDNIKLDFTPNTSLPEWGNVWNEVTVSPNNLVDISYSPRTRELLKFFRYFRSHTLVRVTLPMPMFTSIRYKIKLAESFGVDFEWSPSERPEIYFIIPFKSTDYYIDVNLSPGNFTIEQTQQYIFAEGQVTSVVPTILVAPYMCDLYVPKAVTNTTTTKTNVTIDSQVNSFTLQTPSYVLFEDFDIPISNLPLFFQISSDDLPLVSYCEITNFDGRAVLAYNTNGPFAAGKYFITPVLGTVKLAIFGTNLENYKEQILEYNYNPEFKQNSIDHGEMTDHSDRSDNIFVETSELLFENSQQIRRIEFPTVESPAFIDFKRHYFKSKYPLIKLASLSLPTTNVKMRVQFVNDSTPLTKSNLLQLPGWEFDPKDGPFIFQPYWNARFPVKTNFSNANLPESPDYVGQSLYVMVLSGSVGQGILNIKPYFNFSSVEYHNIINEPFSIDPTRTNYVEQIDDLKSELDEPSLISEDTTPEEHTKDILITSPQQTINLTNPTESENRWTFVDRIIIPKNTKFATFPINIYSLGKYFYEKAKYYRYWRGCPTFKFVFVTGSNINSAPQIIQSNIDATALDTLFPPELIPYCSFANSTFHSNATVLRTEWRAFQQRLPVQVNANTENLGKIVIALPSNTADDTTVGISTNTFVIVYVDDSKIQLSYPGINQVNDYVRPNITFYSSLATIK